MVRMRSSSTALCSSITINTELDPRYTRVLSTKMPSHGRFELWGNRPTNWEPIRLDDGSESDESFRQRLSEAEEEKKAYRRLNELSKRVREKIDTRLWATMYLRYLMKRIHTVAPVHIEFRDTDLPNIKNLSLSDEALAHSPEEHLERPFQDLSVEIQLQILKRRLKDAHIGVEAIWATLSELIVVLTLGK